MLRTILENKVLLRLQRVAQHRFMPSLAGAFAFALTVSLTVPVTSLLIPAVLLSPPRWRSIALQAACGSALGATLLVILFHELGWQQLQALYPGLLDSPGWRRIIEWTGDYGVIALFVVAAMPVPQTPALVFCAIASLPGLNVFLAMLFGKIIKYGVLGALAARFPAKFRVFLDRFEPARGVSAHRGWG